jgi:hypothetical protein
VNRLQRIERGEWVAAHNLFQVCSVLDLRVAQTVDVNDPSQDFGTGRDAAAEDAWLARRPPTGSPPARRSSPGGRSSSPWPGITTC